MELVTLDFETYYDKEFSLRKMTTEAYVRDDRFKVLGVATKCGSNPPVWVSDICYTGHIRKHLKSLCLQDRAVLCHNSAFDGAILSWIYGIKPKFWFDTLSMARPTNAMTTGCSLDALAYAYKLGVKGKEILNSMGKHKEDFTSEEWDRFIQYATNDVELTYKLFKALKKDFPTRELMVIDKTIRMYTEPMIELDKKVLEEHLLSIKKKKKKLLGSLPNLTEQETAVDTQELWKKILMSNDKFAKILKMNGVEPPTKISPTTGKKTNAFAKTDEGFNDLLENGSSEVQLLCQARLGTKSTIEETRTESLIGVADRGKLPIMLHYYGAHTGRFSGGDKLNLQNLPRNGTIRKSLTAGEGRCLLACDSSQIEARVLAYIAGQDNIVQAFREGRDVYSEFASEVYGRKITKENKLERFVGKTCILGLGYGMGATKFADTVNAGLKEFNTTIDEIESKRIVDTYRRTNWKIKMLWDKCNAILHSLYSKTSGQITDLISYDPNGIRLPNDMYVRYPALQNNNSSVWTTGESPFSDWRYISNSRTFRKYIKARVTGDRITHNEWTKIYGGKVVENIVQALARIIIAEQMIEIGRYYPVAFQVHDELIINVDESEKENAEKQITTIMSTPPIWASDLPVACEVGIGHNYGECK